MPRKSHAELKALKVDADECIRVGCHRKPWGDTMTCEAHTMDDRERRRRSKRQLKRARRSQVVMW